MSNLTAARNQLFGTPVRAARQAQPWDRFSKRALWDRVQALEKQLAETQKLANTMAHEANHERRYAERDRLYEIGTAADVPKALANTPTP